MDALLEGGCGEGRAPETAIAEQIPLEAERGQSRQRRQDPRPIVGVGRMQLQLEQRAMLVADDEALDALDQLAAVDAPRPRRCTPIRSRSIASSSASTAKMNTSISARMFQPSPRLGQGTARAEGGGSP